MTQEANDVKTMTDDHPQAQNAVDAVRFLYLARVAERRGHADAARRWYDRAAGWLRGNGLPLEEIRHRQAAALPATDGT